jgi:3D (Asp-Asp-Asp) domain-containing protein
MCRLPISLCIVFSFLFIIFIASIPVHCQTVREPSDSLTVYMYNLRGKTSTGEKTGEIKEPFLAISRDLLSKYPLYTKVILYNCTWKGEYRVMDIMGARHKKSADIYYRGKRRNVAKCLCTYAEK